VQYGEPIRLEGTGNEDDAAIEGHVERVKAEIARLIATGRAARKERKP